MLARTALATHGDMEEEYKIEDAKPEDTKTVRSIARSFWIELYPNEKYGITKEDLEGIDWFNPERLAKRADEIQNKTDTMRTWVLKNKKGEIIGFSMAFKTEDYGELDAMFVNKEYQGKGLGKKLMQKACDWIGSDLDIKLKVVAYNTHAIEFYKKNGFEETDAKVVYEGTVLPSGIEIPRIEMLRKKSI